MSINNDPLVLFQLIIENTELLFEYGDLSFPFPFSFFFNKLLWLLFARLPRLCFSLPSLVEILEVSPLLS